MKHYRHLAIAFLMLFIFDSMAGAAIIKNTNSTSHGASGSGNPADLIRTRQDLIYKKISKAQIVTNELTAFFEWVRLNLEQTVSDRELKKTFDSVFERNPDGIRSFLNDVWYEIRVNGACKDFEGTEKPATTFRFEDRWFICLSPYEFAKLHASPAEVLGILVHEVIEQFGFSDDMARRAEVFATYGPYPDKDTAFAPYP